MNKSIIANWKMNPASEAEAIQLAKASDEKGVVICPPFVFLSDVRGVLRKADLGAQDVFWENPLPGGPFTGQVSVSMLKNAGVTHVIIGHSERRKHLNETDEMINKKVKTSLGLGLKVILCVGEPLAVRKESLSAAKNFIKSQLLKDLKNIYNLKPKTQNLVIAYEPIWAIGTGRPDDPSETASMANFIKTLLAKPYWLNPKVIYGGSVTSLNVARIFEYNEIDGALVGGASLKANEFKKIIKITAEIRNG